MLAIAAVTIHTWKSAQATGSIGQLIYETNTDKRDAPPATRPARGVLYERSPSHRRVLAIAAVSLTVTAIIVAAWLA